MPFPMMGCISRGSLQCAHMISGVVFSGFPLRKTRPFSYFAAAVSAAGTEGWLELFALLTLGCSSREERASDSAWVAADCMRRSFSERWQESTVLNIMLNTASSRMSFVCMRSGYLAMAFRSLGRLLGPYQVRQTIWRQLQGHWGAVDPLIGCFVLGHAAERRWFVVYVSQDMRG